MQDKQTESFWSHVTGKALLGELKGIELSVIPAVQTVWSDWVEQHPETKVLKKNKEIKSSSYEEYFKNENRIGIFRTNWLQEKLPGKMRVAGITVGPHALAIPKKKFNSDDFIQTILGNKKIVVTRGKDGGIRGYHATANSKNLAFYNDKNTGNILDRETGSTWNLYKGKCTKGPLKGTQLKELQVTIAFWFGWSSFYPNTKVID